MLSKKEKEEKAKELLKKGMTIRFIAEELKMSFSDIGALRRELDGETKEIPLSLNAKAFKLFLENKTLVEVAIILNIPTNEVLKIHSEFLLLQNRSKLAEILDKNQDRAAELIKLSEYLDKNQIKRENVWKHLDLEKELDDYKIRNKSLEQKMLKLSNLNIFWQSEVQNKNRKYQFLLKSVRERQNSNSF